MKGLGNIRFENRAATQAAPVKVLTERARRMLVDIAEDVDRYLEVKKYTGPIADEVALATFRGAFLALLWTEDADLSSFAREGLIAVNLGRMAAVQTLLTQFKV